MELELPERILVPLNKVKDVEHAGKQDVNGFVIKAMSSDPYGHPAFAVTEAKNGFLMIYDAEEGRVLRRIGAGTHIIESVDCTPAGNFILAVNSPQERSIQTYSFKGERLQSFIPINAEHLYSVVSIRDGRIAVSLCTTDQQNVVQMYTQDGHLEACICNDEEGNGFFSKPQYMVATDHGIVVGDVVKKTIFCLDTNFKTGIKWRYPMETPRGLCVDGGDNICVCDFRNNKVSLIRSQDGRLLGHPVTGLSKPQYVTISNNFLYTLDQAKSTSYRLSRYKLHMTAKRRNAKPDWQS